MEYANLLTASEHRAAFDVGVAIKAAEFGAVEKQALAWNVASDTTTAAFKVAKLLTLASVAIGVPIGIGAHWATQTANKQTAKERELFEKARLYRQTAEEMNRRFAAV